MKRFLIALLLLCPVLSSASAQELGFDPNEGFNGGLVLTRTENSLSNTWGPQIVNFDRDKAPHPQIEKDGYTDKFYVMVFKGENCPHCKNLPPLIKEARDNGIKVYVFDSRQNNFTFRKLNVRTMPTVIMMKDGEEKARLIGAKSRQTYLRKIEQINGIQPDDDPKPDEPKPQPSKPAYIY